MSRPGSEERQATLSGRALAAALGVALSACAGGSAGGAGGSSPPGAAHPLVGAPAPAFELPAVPGGQAQSLAAYAGKVVIVDFWATWCEPCKQSFPAYQKLVDKLQGKVVVLAVSQDDDAQGIPSFVQDTGAKFPIVWDDGNAVAKSYDPPTMPTAFVVDADGIIRFVHAGYRAGDEAVLEEEVKSLQR